MGFQHSEKRNLLMSFLRHRVSINMKKEDCRVLQIFDIYVNHQAIPGELLSSRAHFRFA